MFFTVLAREEKYKAKNLIDVVVYRGSDAIYGWLFDSLAGARAEAGGDRAVRFPGGRPGWLVLSTALGRAQERRAAPSERVAAQGGARHDHDPITRRRALPGWGWRGRP